MLTYFNIENMSNRSEKSLISNWNLMFVKILNYSLTYLLLWASCPNYLKVSCVCYYLHMFGSVIFGLVSLFNLSLVGALWFVGATNKRPSTTFNPFRILLATLSTPLVMIIDLYVVAKNPLGMGKQLIGFLATFGFVYCRMHPNIPYFEDAIFLDIWAFFFIFLFRKYGWLRENLKEKDQIVDYFTGTCWGRITRAPVLEFLYCATTGLCNVFAVQIGKLVMYLFAQKFPAVMLAPGGLLHSFYIASLLYYGILFLVASTSPSFYNSIRNEVNEWYYRHHKFLHTVPSQYITKHFEHHDVIPLASIGANDTGYQESVHRSLTLTLYGPICGFNIVSYINAIQDEWDHNYCPAASNSGIIARKPIHLEHHMNHTVPFGFIYEVEVEKNNFKYDEAIWNRIETFAPDLKYTNKKQV